MMARIKPEDRLGHIRELKEQLAASKQREAELMADNARLREWIVNNIYNLDRSCILTRDGNLYCDCCNAEKGKPHNQGCILAATPAQSLARLRDEVLDRAAKKCAREPRRFLSDYEQGYEDAANNLADEIIAMKEPECE